jgi:hypothetical protein
VFGDGFVLVSLEQAATTGRRLRRESPLRGVGGEDDLAGYRGNERVPHHYGRSTCGGARQVPTDYQSAAILAYSSVLPRLPDPSGNILERSPRGRCALRRPQLVRPKRASLAPDFHWKAVHFGLPFAASVFVGVYGRDGCAQRTRNDVRRVPAEPHETVIAQRPGVVFVPTFHVQLTRPALGVFE